MHTTRTLTVIGSAAAVLALAACGSGSGGTAQSAATSASAQVSSAAHSHDMGSMTSTTASASATSGAATTSTPSGTATTSMAMDHQHAMDGGPAPAGMKPATNAKHPVGSKVTLKTDHMPGMNGAQATVVGVYSTVTYAVDYTPTTGEPEVKDHKWVVQEELKEPGATRLADGAPVTIEADHMPGMKGAKGTVASSTTEPVYIVDYTVDGMTMKNHKWVVESEIAH